MHHPSSSPDHGARADLPCDVVQELLARDLDDAAGAGAASWRAGAARRLRALADVFLDPVFVSEMRAEGPHVHAALERAGARARAVHRLGSPTGRDEVWAAMEAIDRSMLELKAAVGGIDVAAWWSHAELREALAR